MVKKSFLGRIFGKKSTPKKQTAKQEKPKESHGVATATVKKKDGNGSSFSARVNKAAKEGRFDKKDNRITDEKRTQAMTSPKPDAPKKKAEKAPTPPPPPKPVEPEILTRTEKVATESREKIDVIAKKMSSQEEVTIKMSEGIKGISGILSNIDQRMEEQNQNSTELIRSVNKIPEMMKDMPESSRAGVELLQTIGQVLENQSRATSDLSKKMGEIPDVLEKLNKKIDQEGEFRAKERTVIKEAFDTSVDTMKTSMKDVKTSMNDLEKKQVDIVKSQDSNTKKLVESFKNIQNDQNQQINRLIDKNRTTNKLVAMLLGIIVVAIIVYLATLS